MGFWAIDEKPTGSKDPYALRRAALGVVRILLERKVRLPLSTVVEDNDLISFFHDRLKVYLRDLGARHDLIDAVLAAPPHPALRATFSPLGRRGSKGQRQRSLLPSGEKVPEGRMRGPPMTTS